MPVDTSQNGHAEPDVIPDFEQQLKELQTTVEDLRAQNATLREQMLQANLYELQQRRECDALREELSQLRASQ